MLNSISEYRSTEPDSALIGALYAVDNLFLATVTSIACLNILGWLVPSVSTLFKSGWNPMSAEAAIAALLSVASLTLCRPRYGAGLHAVSVGIAAVVSIGSALVLAGRLIALAPPVVSGTASWIAKGMTPQAAACFVLLGLTIVINRAPHLEIVADISTFLLLFCVLVLATGQIIGITHVFGPVSTFAMAGATALCLLLLALVVSFRRAERGGIFSILLGRGIGSNVARVLAPCVLVGPYIREVVRAHLLDSLHVQQHYLAAVLATVAVVLGIAILLYLAWRLNALETEIQGLSLRDALTGLYNLRGFRLLSEQSMLMAHRSGQPYSVLFIDVDNLKQINDALGHQTGSELLAAAAEVLRETFRETDVLGRLGGDEFAVAGQFSEVTIAEAVERLRQAAMLYNANASKSALRFSAGWATSGPDNREPLTDLLARADEEMYREKRRRKASAAGRSKQSPEVESTQALPQEKSSAAELHEVG